MIPEPVQGAVAGITFVAPERAVRLFCDVERLPELVLRLAYSFDHAEHA
ncbi:MAG: hypothetical protein ACHREM_14365 [Polyangiales bacterium]